MSNNSNTRTSHIVYTSVDDDMTVTEIICDYDCDDSITEAVCEVESPDLTQAHIYIDENTISNNLAPIVKEEKSYLEVDSREFKEEKIFIDEATDETFHQIFSADKKFKCGVCCQQFDDLTDITRHMEEHSGEKKYECAECGKQFKNINNVMRHMVVHSGERKYLCPVCQKPFAQVGNLKRHMFVHSGEKKFPCNVCGKSFTQMNNLMRHQAIHSGQKDYECNMCHRTFNQASNLNRHLLIHRGVKLFKCDVCGRAFAQLTNMQKHKERHLRGKKYKCDVCNEGFDQKIMYNRHLETHFGKPRYQCTLCNRVVTQKSTLSQHMLLHYDQKKYNCEQCNKSYAQKGSLLKHMESHSQTKYFCKVCNRYFYDEGGLQKHEATHTDKAKSIAGIVKKEIKVLDYDLQFCEICGKSFILKRSLHKHMERTHNIIVEDKRKTNHEMQCNKCGKVLVNKKGYKKHMLREHGVHFEFVPDKMVKEEKENDSSVDLLEENADDIPQSHSVDKLQVGETLPQMKQESVSEASMSMPETEQVLNDITSCKVKEESGQKLGGATIHLCEICGRGYYLMNNLHRHKQIKHGLPPIDKENVNENVNESVQMMDHCIFNESSMASSKETGFQDEAIAEVKEVVVKPSMNVEKDNITIKKSNRRGKRKMKSSKDADICDLCGRGFLTPTDLLMHMLEHSKAKKNELLCVINEAAQELQSLKEAEAELHNTEKTKGLVSHFRKCSRMQSDDISSVFSISESYDVKSYVGGSYKQETYKSDPSVHVTHDSVSIDNGSLKHETGDTCTVIHETVTESHCGQESIVTECLEVGLEVKQEVIEINEFVS